MPLAKPPGSAAGNGRLLIAMLDQTTTQTANREAHHMPTTTRTLIKVFALMTVTLSAATPSRADDPVYVGTWGTDAAHCKIAQDAEGAPLVITKDRYDQHEAHCVFKSVTPEAALFKVVAECSVEGDTQAQDFTLSTAGSAAGDTLTWADSSGALDLIRCK